MSRVRVAAYVYPGWHPIPERDQSFHPGFTEWELVEACRPRFEGHAQPRLPLLGTYDDRDPIAVGRRIRAAREHGVDALIYGTFWCRGKRVFEEALPQGFLACSEGADMPFAVMWANRMPRRVLPVRRSELPVIEEGRLVNSDVEDFLAWIASLADGVFDRPNYLRLDGALYLSIFDSTHFLRELGLEAAKEAVSRARTWLLERGLGPLHLAAIEPNAEMLPQVAGVGFDSVTHYVYLPDWKGPQLQDYERYAEQRAGEWAHFTQKSGLPYFPSVAPGWDASPRAADFGKERPGKYPWSPVVTGEHPRKFQGALERGLVTAREVPLRDSLLMIASLNEWSEGHYLEPDQQFGYGWLEAVRDARRRSGV